MAQKFVAEFNLEYIKYSSSQQNTVLKGPTLNIVNLNSEIYKLIRNFVKFI